MDGKLTLEIINYSILVLVFLFGLISLVLTNQMKKLIFLFLTFLAFGILCFLFLTGATFMLIAIIVIFFNILLFLYVQDIEHFSKRGNYISESGLPVGKLGLKKDWKRITNLTLSILSCLGIGSIFYEYSLNFFKSYKQTGNYTTSRIAEIVANIGSNYWPVLILISLILIVSVLWFISILKNSDEDGTVSDGR
ncbi:MAG: hypothetical protein IMZ41_03565, partial [Actinobacteria bacterium]|nr:hypothetical protein [Actinomycetota bacterium]